VLEEHQASVVGDDVLLDGRRGGAGAVLEGLDGLNGHSEVGLQHNKRVASRVRCDESRLQL